MSKKIFTFTAHDGSVWGFPIEVVADSRARYFNEEDVPTTYEAEYEYALPERVLLCDWLTNNMNLEDFAPYIKKISGLEASWGMAVNCDGLRLVLVDPHTSVEFKMPEKPEAK